MLWRKLTNARVEKQLLFGKGAVLKTTSAAGVVSTIDLAELAALDNIAAADLAKIDGITNGTAAAGKALVADSNVDVTGVRNFTVTGSFIIGSASMDETDLEKLDGITNGTQAAAKAIVNDANVNQGIAKVTALHIGTSGSETQVTATAAELNYCDITTLGVSQASKVLTTDAAESLLWATTDSTASETVTLSVADTRTGAGATGWAIKGELATNVSLGSYANGVYGILNFTGSGGGVTGLGAGVCAEIVMSAGTGAGTYAALELEVGMPTGALSGNSGTSFMYCSLYGADAATFDTSGYLFQLAGYTKAGGKFVQDTTSGATIRPVQVIKVKTLDGDRYLPLYSTAAIAA